MVQQTLPPQRHPQLLALTTATIIAMVVILMVMRMLAQMEVDLEGFGVMVEARAAKAARVLADATPALIEGKFRAKLNELLGDSKIDPARLAQEATFCIGSATLCDGRHFAHEAPPNRHCHRTQEAAH